MMKRILALLLALMLMIPATFAALAEEGEPETVTTEQAAAEETAASEEDESKAASETPKTEEMKDVSEEKSSASEETKKDTASASETKEKADESGDAPVLLSSVSASEATEGGSSASEVTEGGSSASEATESGSSESETTESGSSESEAAEEEAAAEETPAAETKPITTVTTSKGRILKMGMSGDDVLAAQKRLHELYYYNAKMDGKFGTALAGAVRNFQSKNGLTVDGKIGPKTLAKLNSASAIDKYEGLTPAPVLKAGDHGENVKKLQRALRETYYYTGTIDGIYGAVVTSAVKAFQASTNLTVDGKAGPKTQDALYNRTGVIFQSNAKTIRALSSGMRGYDVKVLQDKLSSLGYLTTRYTVGYYDAETAAAVRLFEKANNITVDGKVGSVVRRYLWPSAVSAEEDAENAEKGTVDDPYVEPTIRQGSSGSLVANAQMRLKAAGYLLGNADGVFGPITKAAVLKLQKAYDLKQDGIIGPETWGLIKALSVENAEQDIYGDGKTSTGAATRKLYRGSRGNAVRKLQQALEDLGYSVGEKGVDGKFGPDTADALKAFQKDAEIRVDGIAGTQTYSAITDRLGILWN